VLCPGVCVLLGVSRFCRPFWVEECVLVESKMLRGWGRAGGILSKSGIQVLICLQGNCSEGGDPRIGFKRLTLKDSPRPLEGSLAEGGHGEVDAREAIRTS